MGRRKALGTVAGTAASESQWETLCCDWDPGLDAPALLSVSAQPAVHPTPTCRLLPSFPAQSGCRCGPLLHVGLLCGCRHPRQPRQRQGVLCGTLHCHSGPLYEQPAKALVTSFSPSNGATAEGKGDLGETAQPSRGAAAASILPVGNPGKNHVPPTPPGPPNVPRAPV